MDFSEVIDTVKDKLESLDKKMLIIISALILTILVCLLLLVIIYSKKPKKTDVYEPSLVLTESLMIPESPKLPKDYNISRKTKDKWSDDDTAQWFTVPSDRDIDSLSSTNDKIVNDIIEAAP